MYICLFYAPEIHKKVQNQDLEHFYTSMPVFPCYSLALEEEGRSKNEKNIWAMMSLLNHLVITDDVIEEKW